MFAVGRDAYGTVALRQFNIWTVSYRELFAVVVRAKQDTGQAKQDTVRSNQDTAFLAEPERSGGSVKNAVAPPSPTFTA